MRLGFGPHPQDTHHGGAHGPLLTLEAHVLAAGNPSTSSPDAQALAQAIASADGTNGVAPAIAQAPAGAPR